MLDVIIIRDLTKMVFICIFSYLTYFRITNKTRENKFFVIILVESSIIGSLYVILNDYIGEVITFFACILLHMILLKFFIKDKTYLYIVGYIFSVVIVYLLHFMATFVIAMLSATIMNNVDFQNVWFVVPILLLAIGMYYGMFKIKRFKNGFNFLKNNDNNIKMLIFISSILGIVLIIFGLSNRYNTVIEMIFIICGALVMVGTLLLITRRLITKYYKKHMRDRTIEIQKKEIDEQLETLEHVKSENIRLATIIHKYNSRISALERSITKAMSNMNTEFAGELSVMLDETKGLSKELEEQTKRNINVPTTGVYGIDNMFQFMYEECINNDINFSLKITDSINYLIENVVKKEKLETLIGDHIKDAIIAINSGSPEYKSILCILGVVRDAYEFSVYDTGIDFDIDTLLKLGIEQVTTHKDTGGSGIGFMTTFETMKECGASLLIEEYDKKTTHYTKSITIRFDGKNEYRIYSYRYKEIKKASKDKRIIINNIE